MTYFRVRKRKQTGL